MLAILSPFFYPEPISTGKYNTELALQLAAAGNEVTVICSHPIYPEWRVKRTKDELPGLRIRRGGAFCRYPSNVWLRRIILETWFAFFCLLHIMTLKRSEAILAVVPPSLFLYCLPNFLLSRTIIIVHDLQLVHLGDTKNKFKRYLGSWIKKVESNGFINAKAVCFLSQEMRDEALTAYGLSERKTKIVYPPITVSNFENNGELDHIFSKKETTVVYSGALGAKQSPDELLRLAESLVGSRKDTRFIFISSGPDFERLKASVGHPKIEFHSLIPTAYVGEMLTRSTVQIVPQAVGTSKGSLPSKVPNILASGCLAFVITDQGSELSKLLKHADGVAVSNTWELEANTLAITELIESKDNSEKAEIQKNRQTLLHFFSHEEFLSDILKD